MNWDKICSSCQQKSQKQETGLYTRLMNRRMEKIKRWKDWNEEKSTNFSVAPSFQSFHSDQRERFNSEVL